MMKKRILFVCSHNSARSQMAEAWLRSLAGDRFEVYSAGTEPRGVHPLAIEAMREMGIDLGAHWSKHIDEYRDRPMHVVVTVCDAAREACPYVPALEQQLHQDFEDPSAATGSDAVRLSTFRRVRDEIRAWVESTFVAQPTGA